MLHRSLTFVAVCCGLLWGCGGSSDNPPATSPLTNADAGPDDAATDTAIGTPDVDVEDDATADSPSDSPVVDGPQPDAESDGGLVPEDCAKLSAFDLAVGSASESQRVQLVDELVQQVTAGDGFPIRCGEYVTFLFDAPVGFGAPAVAGDFNDFDSSAAPMQPVVERVYRATLAVDEGLNRYLYKFTDGALWEPDPLARRFGYDIYGEYSLVSGGLAQGHLERYRGVTGGGLEPREVTVYLPPGYEASQDSYPLLVAHDGQNLFDPAAMFGSWRLDETIEQMLSGGWIRPFIVAGVHNTADRMDEYTHVQDVLDTSPIGGKADQYYELVVGSVMPLMSAHYRLQHGPENTWTMGSSLGGLISLYFGMKHPEVFGRVAGLSSTLGWGSIGASNQTLIELLPTLPHPPVVFYLDSGGGAGATGCIDSDGDGIFDDSPQAKDNYCETVQMRDVMESEGYEFDVDLFHWHEAGALHNEAAWAARVFRPLQVLAAP